MNAQSEWIAHDKVNWVGAKIKQYHVDTRDFHVQMSTKPKADLYLNKIVNYGDRFFFTRQEVKDWIHKIFVESGGKGKWRCLMFEGAKDQAEGWVKYIRIYDTPHGMVICNDDEGFLKREHLELRVIQGELLSHRL